MVDLEKYALRRDGRFLWRLGGALGAAVTLAAMIFGQLTRDDVADCAARGFRQMTAQETPQNPPQGGTNR